MRQQGFAPALRGQDVVVLLKLFLIADPWTVRSLAEELTFDHAGVARCLDRLEEAGLYHRELRRPPLGETEEFLVHAVKFVFPAHLGRETRGWPTAWAHPPLKDLLASHDRLPPIWPSPDGPTRGLSVRPLHKVVPSAARRDPLLGVMLALVDALRLREPRVARLAVDELITALRRAGADA
jgi:hypothetical protein